MRLVGTRGSLGTWCMCCTYGSMIPHLSNACRAGALKFCDSDGHVEPAASVRLCGKNHEI